MAITPKDYTLTEEWLIKKMGFLVNRKMKFPSYPEADFVALLYKNIEFLGEDEIIVFYHNKPIARVLAKDIFAIHTSLSIPYTDVLTFTVYQYIIEFFGGEIIDLWIKDCRYQPRI